MKPLATLIICLLLSFSAHAETCQPPALSAAAIDIIKPLVELRIREAGQQFSDDGRWRGESEYSADVERLFYAMLENRSPAGDQALAYFLFIDMGEYPDEESVCETINRGKRMLPLIKAYRQCRPIIGIEPLPRRVRGSGALATHASEQIRAGRKCDIN